ncbi:hypothetical protein [Castellaniella sp.]|uniref:hypothetical protein n=1 Tax=Castellaniella sp. TaxID=1955812 RepID=UPI003C765062
MPMPTPAVSVAPSAIAPTSAPLADAPIGTRLRTTLPASHALQWLATHQLGHLIQHQTGTDTQGPWQQFWLPGLPGAGTGTQPQAGAGTSQQTSAVAPSKSGTSAQNLDTTALAQTLGLSPDTSDADLDTEILAAMLLSPLGFEFPSLAEWQSAVRLRRFIVQAGRRTVLAFDTEEAERPDCWRWAEATGFVLLPGHELIPALQEALWPDVSGRLYSFSCYRATEHVVLLGLAQELQISNPAALAALQAQWQRKAIQSEAFQDAFLYEYGSLQTPLPSHYYVPGDRLWFRNPDAVSAGIEGYEGSWVFYLGQGRFTNFWKPNQAYTLVSKCVELYHWRHGVRTDGPSGQPWMDESIIEARVAETLADGQATQAVLQRMMRLRDPAGVYAEGGCIDASREAVRCVHPQTFGLRIAA